MWYDAFVAAENTGLGLRDFCQSQARNTMHDTTLCLFKFRRRRSSRKTKQWRVVVDTCKRWSTTCCAETLTIIKIKYFIKRPSTKTNQRALSPRWCSANEHSVELWWLHRYHAKMQQLLCAVVISPAGACGSWCSACSSS